MTATLDQPGTNRFTCALAPACRSYARVTIADTEGDTARACPCHAVAALNGVTGARVIWADTRGINDHERTALRIAEDRSQLAAGPRMSPCTCTPVRCAVCDGVGRSDRPRARPYSGPRTPRKPQVNNGQPEKPRISNPQVAAAESLTNANSQHSDTEEVRG
jgi:hypothetical protein